MSIKSLQGRRTAYAILEIKLIIETNAKTDES